MQRVQQTRCKRRVAAASSWGRGRSQRRTRRLALHCVSPWSPLQHPQQVPCRLRLPPAPAPTPHRLMRWRRQALQLAPGACCPPLPPRFGLRLSAICLSSQLAVSDASSRSPAANCHTCEPSHLPRPHREPALPCCALQVRQQQSAHLLQLAARLDAVTVEPLLAKAYQVWSGVNGTEWHWALGQACRTTSLAPSQQLADGFDTCTAAPRCGCGTNRQSPLASLRPHHRCLPSAACMPRTRTSGAARRLPPCRRHRGGLKLHRVWLAVWGSSLKGMALRLLGFVEHRVLIPLGC